MFAPFKKLLTIAAAGILALGLGVPSAAHDEEKEAPLVGGLKDLETLSAQLVLMAPRSSDAAVSLVSRGGGGAGSGVIVSEDGLILTAGHVLASLSDDVVVIFPDGTRKPAERLGADFDRDAAMVKITEKGSYPFAEMGKSEDLLRNQWCVALGHPGGFDPMRRPPLRLGRVLVNGSFVTTDCAVVGGDSGGPLFDTEGKVIGIHSNIGTSLTENRHVPIGVYQEQWDDLVAGKRTGRRFAQAPVDPNRPVMGVRLGDPGENGGVTVTGVAEGSPAAKAGLREGDVVMEVNGKAVSGARELISSVNEFEAGDEVKVTYRRDGEDREVDVELLRLGQLLEDEWERGERPPRREGRERENRDDGDRRSDGGEKRDEDAEDGADPKEQGGGEEGADEGELDPQLEELLDEALEGVEDMLGEEQLEEVGGIEGLRRMLTELARSFGPDGLREMLEMQLGGPDHFFESSMQALAPLTAKAAAATVTVLVDGEPAALGTVVTEDGWILTKNSETKEGSVTMQNGINQKGAVLELVKRYPKRDLALYKGKIDGLEPVQWTEGEKVLPLGSLLTAPGNDGEPLGIGLVSVHPRALGDVGFLGIQAGDAEGGVRVVRTTRGGPAREAGLQADDVIIAIDGAGFAGALEFGQFIRSYKAGDEIEITYKRDGEEAKLNVKLAAREAGEISRRFQRMNTMSGPLSEQLTGFPEALQHDIPLDPSQCGGPLLDLSGRCVGINVSRAGRVKTLAVPVGDLRKLLADARADMTSPEAESGASQMKEREAVLKELGDVEQRLGEIDKRLEELNAR